MAIRVGQHPVYRRPGGIADLAAGVGGHGSRRRVGLALEQEQFLALGIDEDDAINIFAIGNLGGNQPFKPGGVTSNDRFGHTFSVGHQALDFQAEVFTIDHLVTNHPAGIDQLVFKPLLQTNNDQLCHHKNTKRRKKQR